jgi:hypothetical protein
MRKRTYDETMKKAMNQRMIVTQTARAENALEIGSIA